MAALRNSSTCELFCTCARYCSSHLGATKAFRLFHGCAYEFGDFVYFFPSDRIGMETQMQRADELAALRRSAVVNKVLSSKQ
jgi:hypothetical protein